MKSDTARHIHDARTLLQILSLPLSLEYNIET